MITLIKDILAQKPEGQDISVHGWVRTKRETKNLIFVQVNDGSCLASIQLTFDRDKGLDAQTEQELSKIGTGASIKAEGALIASPASGQTVEVAAKTVFVYGEAAAETYPLQKKRHSFEFLREIAHLRVRTNTFGAIARMRNQMAFAVHTFFQERGFQYVHTPLIRPPIAKAPVKCFALRRSICRRLYARHCAIRLTLQLIHLITSRIFLKKKLI